MSTNHPLTLTVEQAAEVLGVGRSTAYELVRTGEIRCIRLRRRVVVPVAHLAESLGVDREAVWDTLRQREDGHANPDRGAPSRSAPGPGRRRITSETPTLF